MTALPIEYLPVFTVPAGVDTTRLQWEATTDTLAVRGTLTNHGRCITLDQQWAWPTLAPKEQRRWWLVVRVDDTVAFVTDRDRADHQYRYRPYDETAIAHGWLFHPDAQEPWEWVVWVLRIQPVERWTGVSIVHHLTNHHGHHWTYTDRDGQVLVRQGHPTLTGLPEDVGARNPMPGPT